MNRRILAAAAILGLTLTTVAPFTTPQPYTNPPAVAGAAALVIHADPISRYQHLDPTPTTSPRREVGKVTRRVVAARPGTKGPTQQRDRTLPVPAGPPTPAAPTTSPTAIREAFTTRLTARQFAAKLPQPWPAIIRCESLNDGTWRTTSSSWARGLFQFLRSSWRLVGGHGDPAAATFTEQYTRARALLKLQGWAAWACARIVGVT